MGAHFTEITNSFIPVVYVRNQFKIAEIIKSQIEWISHCGYHATLIDIAAPNCSSIEISQAIMVALGACSSFSRLWLRIECSLDGWRQWNAIRTLCNEPSGKLCVALAFSDNESASAEKIDQWIAEPVELLVVPLSAWSKNQSNRPILGRNIQNALQRMITASGSSVLLEFPVAPPEISNYNSDFTQFDPYADYIQHLRESLPGRSVISRFAQGYEDVLQSPLQPLFDNLDSITYEVFMQDPVKYRLYQEAIYFALSARLRNLSETKIVLLIVGAGSRGPLVSCALKAIKELKCQQKVRIFAVEKNPNALITLQQVCNNDELWVNFKNSSDGIGVQILGGDIRDTSLLLEPCDILISELLGSFGDNELSPECLQAAQTWLKPSGISIPRSSSAFLSPVSSATLHKNVSLLGESKQLAAFETPYVTYFHRANNRIAQPKFAWKFNHPSSEISFDRKCNLEFVIENHPTLVHGFAGYFEAVLWESETCRVILSITPETHSPDMTSWFPIYFPLKTPVQLEIGDRLKVFMWRQTDPKRVWYEWACTINGRVVSHLHNKQGQSYCIRL